MSNPVLDGLWLSVFDFDFVKDRWIEDVMGESVVGGIKNFLMLGQEFIDVFHNFLFYIFMKGTSGNYI